MSRARRGAPTAPAASIPESAAPADAAARAAWLIWGGIAVLVIARAALAFAPGMWAWSLNLHRFLTPAWAWGPWALLALASVPPLAGRLAPAMIRSGDWIARHPRLAALAAAAGSAALALAFPDQVRFTGDFLIRQGTVEVAISPGKTWPQAMPLDAFLHYALPLKLTELGVTNANGAARAIGAIEAAMLGALAVTFISVMRLRGAAVWTAAGIVLGGFLGLFTGYSKSFTEMAVLAAAIGVAGLAVIREGHGLLAMNLAFAVALAVHRSALAFLPAVLMTWALWARRSGRGGWKSWEPRAALLLALAGLAAFVPRILHLVRTVDPVHFASAEVAARGGLFASALEPVRLADSANVLLLLAPLAPLIPLALVGLGRGLPRGREALLLGLLAAPFVISIPLVHALGGLYRDVDDFAAAGAATALLAAWLCAETLRAAPRHAWLALPLLLAAAVPTVQWMAHQTDVARGIRRVEALVSEPPPRTGAERARTWDYVGSRWNQLENFEASADAFGRAAETGPSPRVLQQWAIAEELRGNLPSSLAVYRRLVLVDSLNVSAWGGLAQVAGRLSDRAELRRAVTRLLVLNPADAEAARILRVLDAESAPPSR